ncbi:MAG: hypothetical protein LUH18_08335 [Oscillospiraceae bacterium]|nr:hypothetical protein [Oscillospiraceae bacterium]
MANKYCDYFNINESYFPCIDESAINEGVKWTDTYPHETFIALLSAMEKMLSGATNRSLWIHGAYGTGKSQCAFAMRKILEVPEQELRDYWDSWDVLKNQKLLLEKIIGQRELGIITASRYASGDITTPQQFFFAVQESIKKAMNEQGIGYHGENTLKESVIAWLEDDIHADMMNKLLQKPEWLSMFSQSTTEEIINTLKKSGDVTKLMNNIFALAAKEGITALNLTADSLRNWIIDIITHNNKKIVLIWDEFSDFFRQNRNSLSEFQKIVSICQEAPFYLVVVTHPISSLSSADDSWKIVQQRFDKVEITLPSNIAFDLIGNAFSVKKDAQASWQKIADDLDSNLTGVRAAVKKAADVKDDAVLKKMLPLHPMAALVLKNIASAYQANQRSMFDFIKTPKNLDTHAFQWFIQEYGPESDRPLITVDMLWDFFYEKGKDYLSSDIRLILDTFPQQTSLVEKEKVVLKTILIMQAIDQRLGGTVDVLKPTDQNLSYAFEGDCAEYENSCKNIAKALVEKGILIQSPIADGKKVYNAAVLAGDGAKIEGYKKDIRQNGTISKLVSDAPSLGTSLSLTPALKLRFAKDTETGCLPVVTYSDFTKTMDSLKHKDAGWHFLAVLALAKTEEEAQTFRNLIKKTIANKEYENITVIDALSTPLGLEAFEQYVDYSAMALYYNGNKNQQSKDNDKKAKDVLERGWRDRIHDGQFIVYSYENQSGEKATGANAVQSILQTIVLNKYRHVVDFTKGLTESQLKITPQTKSAARCGFGDMDVKGLIAGCEKSVLGQVWSKANYWEDNSLSDNHIVIAKKAVDKLIQESFTATGKISIGEIYDFLQDTYGYSLCNLTAFVLAFLLKEYSSEPYRSMDSTGHREAMSRDKLAEMIAGYVGKSNPNPTYIVNLTDAERAFNELTEEAWSIEPNTCTSPAHAGTVVREKMRGLGFPVWCLEDVDTTGVYDVLEKYISLVQSTDNAHDIANEIGEIYIQRHSVAQNLRKLLTIENCRNGMLSCLERFDDGKLLTLAKDINAEDLLLHDIKNLFVKVEYSALWNVSTGESEIKKLEVEYEVIKFTNLLLNVQAKTKNDAEKRWREKLKFIGYSCDAAMSKMPTLTKFYSYLRMIANMEEVLPEHNKAFFEEITTHFAEIKDVLNNPLKVFMEIYSPYLDGFTEAECEAIKNSITSDLFGLTTTKSNEIVKKAVDDYKKGQIKTQLFTLWHEKAEWTKSPKAWSDKYKTPILCLIDEEQYADVKRAFSILNSTVQSEADIKFALQFLEQATFFDKIADKDYRDARFADALLGSYSSLLTNVNQVRSKLDELGIEAYEWLDNPKIKAKIRTMAQNEYNAGGSDSVMAEIDKMDDGDIKQWLKDLAAKDIELGLKIISNGRK